MFEEWYGAENMGDRFQAEEELLGTAVTVDPLQPWLPLILSEERFSGLQEMFPGEVCRIGGMLTRVRPLSVKKGRQAGRKMCQIWIERPLAGDGVAPVEQIVVFPDTFVRFEPLIQTGKPVLAYVSLAGDGPESGLSLRALFRLDHLGGGSSRNGQAEEP
jgi:hypothetical protein